jgi:hypothetical protein
MTWLLGRRFFQAISWLSLDFFPIVLLKQVSLFLYFEWGMVIILSRNVTFGWWLTARTSYASVIIVIVVVLSVRKHLSSGFTDGLVEYVQNRVLQLANG